MTFSWKLTREIERENLFHWDWRIKGMKRYGRSPPASVSNQKSSFDWFPTTASPQRRDNQRMKFIMAAPPPLYDDRDIFIEEGGGGGFHPPTPKRLLCLRPPALVSRAGRGRVRLSTNNIPQPFHLHLTLHVLMRFHVFRCVRF